MENRYGDTGMSDLDGKIVEVKKIHKKNIDTANKILKKTIKDINENIPKLQNGIKQLEKIEKEKMADGIEKAAKQSKMHFKATKALGEFSRYVLKEMEESEHSNKIDMKEVVYWKYEDFKSWLKGFNRFINNLDENRKRANKIMGLDYMLKRRVAEGPLNKLVDARNVSRDLLTNEFQIIKAIEDLNRLKDEIYEVESKIVDYSSKLDSINNSIKSITEKKNSLESEVETIENQGKVKAYRDFKIMFQSNELDIGHQINPLKKDFRLLSSKGSSLSTIGSFEIGIARQYEDATLKTFHSDSENEFQMLKSLCEALIANAEDLKIKANHVHRIKQLQQSINSGILKKMQDSSIEISAKMRLLEKDLNLIENVKIIEEKRIIIENKSKELTKLEDEAESTRLAINDEEKSSNDKNKRFKELNTEVLQMITDK